LSKPDPVQKYLTRKKQPGLTCAQVIEKYPILKQQYGLETWDIGRLAEYKLLVAERAYNSNTGHNTTFVDAGSVERLISFMSVTGSVDQQS
jgi:hypothetical protein